VKEEEGEKIRTEEGRRGDGDWWTTGVGCPPLSFNPSNSLD